MSDDQGQTFVGFYAIEDTDGVLPYCPPGTPTRDLCDPFWPSVCSSLGVCGDGADAGTDGGPGTDAGEDGGGGCSRGGGCAVAAAGARDTRSRTPPVLAAALALAAALLIARAGLRLRRPRRASGAVLPPPARGA